MKYILTLFILALCYNFAPAQTYAPEVISIVKRPKAKPLEIGGRRSRISIGWGPKTVFKVLKNVEKPPKLNSCRKNMERGLRQEFKFTDKNDVRLKEDSEYKLRLLLDTTGAITTIEFVSGKKDDLVYSKLLKEIVKYQWKPAVDFGKKVNYVMPIMVVLKPRKNKKTYKIVVPKFLKVKTVF